MLGDRATACQHLRQLCKSWKTINTAGKPSPLHLVLSFITFTQFWLYLFVNVDVNTHTQFFNLESINDPKNHSNETSHGIQWKGRSSWWGPWSFHCSFPLSFSHRTLLLASGLLTRVTKPWPGGPSSLQAADFCFAPGNWDHFSKSDCILVPKSWVGGLDQEMRAPENQLAAVLGLKSMSWAHPLTLKSAFVKQLKTGPTAELVKKFWIQLNNTHFCS